MASTDLVLEFLDGPLAGTRVPLPPGAHVLGRDRKQADIVLADALVSRAHLGLTVGPKGCVVRDLKAANGTLLNGSLLTEAELPLHPGDELLLSGRFRLRLASGDTEAVLDTPHVCSRCGRDISLETFAEGSVLEQAGKFTCPGCLSDDETTDRISKDDLYAELRIGGYQVVRCIAQGGMGTVYEAKQLSVGRRVALKTIRSEFGADDSKVKRFLQEAQTAARISHPNVVMLYDTGSDNGVHFIVMEYVQGRSMQAMIDDAGRLEVPVALVIGRQIAAALQAAHAHDVVHRDVKPANILVTEDGRAKLTDFGIARALERSEMSRLTAQGMAMGTPYYMPPEQLTDAAGADHRADVYSLGATLYHALAGEIPFPVKGRAAMLRAIVQDAPAPLTRLRPEVPSALDAVIQRAMAKRREDRFASAAALEQALAKLAR